MNRKQLIGRITAAALILLSFVLIIGVSVWYVGWHSELTGAQALRATWHVLVLGLVVFWIGMYVADRAR